MTISDKDRSDLIRFYKSMWLLELEMGISQMEVSLEFTYLEEIEDYEQCEGLKQAIEEYNETIKELDND